jgi:hypothetical protein
MKLCLTRTSDNAEINLLVNQDGYAFQLTYLVMGLVSVLTSPAA